MLQTQKIDFANLKHKINIFVLGRLGILSLLESDHFPSVAAGDRSACRGK